MARDRAPATVGGDLERGYSELTADLNRIFGGRLIALVAYGEPDEEGAHTLALVADYTFADLAKCAPLTARWHRSGLATPLILTEHEFRRTLDVFPVEYGEIIARHAVLTGADFFRSVSVAETDLRRGCEQMAKSHLIHLREGFLETRGEPAAVAHLIGASAPAFRRLLLNIERLEPGAASRASIPDELLQEIAAAADATIAEPSALLARYIAAVERLWQYVDGWR